MTTTINGTGIVYNDATTNTTKAAVIGPIQYAGSYDYLIYAQNAYPTTEVFTQGGTNLASGVGTAFINSVAPNGGINSSTAILCGYSQYRYGVYTNPFVPIRPSIGDDEIGDTIPANPADFYGAFRIRAVYRVIAN
jgi:hypothetical protein